MKSGDKIVIFEENGRFYFENAAAYAFSRTANSFKGVAESAGFETEEDMQEYMKEIRKDMKTTHFF